MRSPCLHIPRRFSTQTTIFQWETIILKGGSPVVALEVSVVELVVVGAAAGRVEAVVTDLGADD